MARYLLQATYTSDAWSALIKTLFEHACRRSVAISRGPGSVLLLNMPDDVSMAALGMASAGRQPH
jgi:hypothetical protein